MTDELITQLAKISSLKVPSAASVVRYKNTSASASEISRDLKVDAFVEGSVVRTGDKIRVTAQLIDARTDRHIWAEDYQGDLRDVLVLQNDIATAIAHSVKAKWLPAIPRRCPRLARSILVPTTRISAAGGTGFEAIPPTNFRVISKKAGNFSSRPSSTTLALRLAYSGLARLLRRSGGVTG